MTAPGQLSTYTGSARVAVYEQAGQSRVVQRAGAVHPAERADQVHGEDLYRHDVIRFDDFAGILHEPISMETGSTRWVIMIVFEVPS